MSSLRSAIRYLLYHLLTHALAYILFFFFNDTATTEIYTLSLHDALPICPWGCCRVTMRTVPSASSETCRSEEHTSELQSRPQLVCRLLLEKKKHPIGALRTQQKKNNKQRSLARRRHK